MGCVYEITFPDDSRYVGMTINPLRWRKAQHRYDAKSNRHSSSAHIQKYGLTDDMFTIHLETDDAEILGLMEYEIIGKRRLEGIFLFNNADGGLTAKGFKHSEDAKQRMSVSKTGKYQGEKNRTAFLTDDQVREMISDLHLGMSKKEVQEKFGVSSGYVTDICTGHKWRHIDRPDGFCRKGKDRLVTDQQVKDIRSRVASGEKQVALATEYGVSKATVSAIVSRRIYKNLKD